MDWLEDRVIKIKNIILGKSLIFSLFVYVFLGAIGAAILSMFTDNIINIWILIILNNRTGIISFADIYVSGAQHDKVLGFLMLLKEINMIIYFLIILAVVINIFYRKEIKPAVTALQAEIDYLMLGDYGHEIAFQGNNELGKICKDFDALRKNMISEKRKNWDIGEEQRKINAAFAHDIRTPLTVISGYTDFLLKYYPTEKLSKEAVMEKLLAMKHQEDRLIEFTDTMSTIQKMEHYELSCRWQEMSQIVKKISDVISGIRINTDKEINISFNDDIKHVFADDKLILEVVDNLIMNAVRYADKKISVNITGNENYIYVYVKDDGQGFSDMALRRAKKMYFSEEKKGKGHFGIGLSLSKKICEIHGGDLTIVNGIEKGAIVCAEFHIISK